MPASHSSASDSLDNFEYTSDFFSVTQCIQIGMVITTYLTAQADSLILVKCSQIFQTKGGMEMHSIFIISIR